MQRSELLIPETILQKNQELHYFCQQPTPPLEYIKILCESGASCFFFADNLSEKTAFEWAVIKNHFHIAEFFLDHPRFQDELNHHARQYSPLPARILILLMQHNQVALTKKFLSIVKIPIQSGKLLTTFLNRMDFDQELLNMLFTNNPDIGFIHTEGNEIPLFEIIEDEHFAVAIKIFENKNTAKHIQEASNEDLNWVIEKLVEKNQQKLIELFEEADSRIKIITKYHKAKLLLSYREEIDLQKISQLLPPNEFLFCEDIIATAIAYDHFNIASYFIHNPKMLIPGSYNLHFALSLLIDKNQLDLAKTLIRNFKILPGVLNDVWKECLKKKIDDKELLSLLQPVHEIESKHADLEKWHQLALNDLNQNKSSESLKKYFRIGVPLLNADILINAARLNLLDIVDYLLTPWPNTTENFLSRCTPRDLALAASYLIENNNLQQAKKLIQQNPSIDKSWGDRSLLKSCINKETIDLELVRLLYVEPAKTSEFKQTPIISREKIAFILDHIQPKDLTTDNLSVLLKSYLAAPRKRNSVSQMYNASVNPDKRGVIHKIFILLLNQPITLTPQELDYLNKKKLLDNSLLKRIISIFLPMPELKGLRDAFALCNQLDRLGNKEIRVDQKRCELVTQAKLEMQPKFL